jgi:hypothetical protein
LDIPKYYYITDFEVMIVTNWINYLQMENKNLQIIVKINHLGSIIVDGRVILKMDFKKKY